MMLLLFTFKGTVGEHVVREIDVPADKIYLDSSLKDIDRFIETTDFTKYSHILGLGVYSGRDQSQLRIETECTSQFRNNKNDLERMAIPYFVQPTDYAKLAKGMGSSWCNLVSYKLLKKVPNTRYAFLHIPKAFSVDTASVSIKDLLQAQS